ncbi:response regulator transcription factor [Rhodococcus koreensis]|uniref:response regulator transcription factor n=1 Tax=Rhodococcus koreensis TaxID=99653 RepID=UPI0036D7D4F2
MLMVDDDPDVRHSVGRGLRMSGFTVDTAVDGRDALRQVAADPPDAVVLDIQMPGLNGVAVVTALRAMGNEVPICVLSALDTVNDRVAGLEAGADDYLIKPFDIAELVARLRALLRRGTMLQHRGSARTIGSVHLDPASRLVFVDGVRVDLTKREFELLAVLSENIGVVITRERLMEQVWGYDFTADTNVVDVFISYLRKKLEAGGAARVVQTVRGVGFVVREEPTR